MNKFSRALTVVAHGIKKKGEAYVVLENNLGDKLKVHFPDKKTMEAVIGPYLGTEFDILIARKRETLG